MNGQPTQNEKNDLRLSYISFMKSIHSISGKPVNLFFEEKL
jgi:hypothetical protein